LALSAEAPKKCNLRTFIARKLDIWTGNTRSLQKRFQENPVAKNWLGAVFCEDPAGMHFFAKYQKMGNDQQKKTHESPYSANSVF